MIEMMGMNMIILQINNLIKPINYCRKTALRRNKSLHVRDVDIKMI